MKKTGACHNCGNIGHSMAECPFCIQENKERYQPQHAQDSSDRYRSQGVNVAQEDDSSNYLFPISEETSVKSSDIWLVDSGATQHMTCSKKFMRNYKVFDAGDVYLADDRIVQAIGSGDIVVPMKTPQGMKKGVLANVQHILQLFRNLFSVGRFSKNVGPVTFTKDGCYRKARKAECKMKVREGKGLF